VLFCGEAPGVSEDVIGRPFIGPAGKLLDRIIDQAFGEVQPTYCLTNLVCCFPREAKREGTNEPPKKAIEACRPRLLELIQMCNPRLIVAAGDLARKHLMAGGMLKGRAFCSITHPSAILRADITQQGLMAQRAIVTIADAADEL